MVTPNSKRYIIDRGWLVLFKDLNIAVGDILRYAQLPLDLMSHKTPAVNANEYFRLWDGLAYVMRDDPTFPLQLVESMSAEVFSPPIFACLCSADLNTALARMAKYKPLVGPLQLHVKQSPTHTTVAFDGFPENRPVPLSLFVFELTFWIKIARMATREHIIPTSVHTTLDVDTLTSYQPYWGVAAQTATFNGLTFSAADAAQPFLTANTSIWDSFEPELRRRLDDLTQEASFKERVRACLSEMLASGHYAKSEVASRLAVSSRTLQRRLQQEDTTFQAVLDELREELARHYLSNSEYTSAQIAFLLGYEEPNSFFRAFRGWTGQTPESLRTQLQ